MEKERRRPANRDEYIDRKGRVRKHSAAWYRRKKQLRRRLILFAAGGLLTAAVIVTGLLYFLGILPPGKDGTEASGAAEQTAEAADEQKEALAISGTEQKEEAIRVEENSPEPEPSEAEEDGPGSVSGNAEYGYFTGYTLRTTEETRSITNPEVNSTYGVLADLTDGRIVAQKNADDRIYPASMTKILTILVAAENLEDPEADVTITQEVTDFTYQNDCSAVGFSVGETVPARDLFYGTILPSGADAALSLANHVAGDTETFVELMNRKAAELGLSSTAHFTNPIGLFDEGNYCTVKDMAMILKAAEENELCRDVLNAHIYTTSKTEEHPEGITISNWFLRRIEDKDCHGTVIGAKTGFVVQSGNCAASCLTGSDGRTYICVTGNAHSAWRCIYDHVAIYQDFVSGS